MTETQQRKPGEAGYSAGLLIRDVPQDERPRERLRDQGSQALSNSELLAILLRVGRRNESALTMATRLLRDMDGLKGLQQATFDEISSQSGMAMAKTAQIKAALELGRRLQAEAPEERPVISGPEDIYNIVGSEMVFPRTRRAARPCSGYQEPCRACRSSLSWHRQFVTSADRRGISRGGASQSAKRHRRS